MYKIKSYKTCIDGKIGIRGFWLYVWIIKYKRKEFAYVGRTGDSSSRFATSPMLRLGQHLDSRKTSSANMLHRNLNRLNINPSICKYEFIAIGPLFKEQKTIKDHRRLRDIVAPLETALSIYMKEKGFPLIGKHPAKREYDKKIFFRIKRAINKELRAR